MDAFSRLLGSEKDLPDVYILGRHYNCFLETVPAEIRQAVYEELKRNHDIVSTGEHREHGIQLSVKTLDACLKAYNKVAREKKAVYSIKIKSFIRIMLEDPNLDATFISKVKGKNIHHAQNLRFSDVLLDSETPFREGNEHLQAKRYTQALASYDKAIQIEPLDARAWNNKGYVLSTMRKFAEAVKCFDKALEIAPGMQGGGVWGNKAKALEELGEYEKAVECYDRELEASQRSQK